MKISIVDWLPVIPGIFFSTCGFIIYQIINDTREKKFILPEDGNNLSLILKNRLTGVLFFGILPVLIFRLVSGYDHLSDITGPAAGSGFLWLLPVLFVTLVINYLFASGAENLKMYPQIRMKEWTRGLVLLSALSWIAYLFAYELLFRGLLFFPLLAQLGLWPAIFINTLIYSLVHIPKGRKESIGAIPVGIILCLLAYKTGSFWIAFYIHIMMALSNEWFSIKYHPDINFKK